MLPNQAISSDKSIRFSPLAAARSLTIRSWLEALNASGAMPARRVAISRNAFLSLLSLISRHSPQQLGMVSAELPWERKGDSHQIWRIQVTVESLMIVSSVFGLPRGRIVHSSPNRLAVSVTRSGSSEGPTAIDAATQRRHFGFRLRLVDNLGTVQ